MLFPMPQYSLSNHSTIIRGIFTPDPNNPIERILESTEMRMLRGIGKTKLKSKKGDVCVMHNG